MEAFVFFQVGEVDGRQQRPLAIEMKFRVFLCLVQNLSKMAGTPAFLHQVVQLVQDLEQLLVLGIELFISNAECGVPFYKVFGFHNHWVVVFFLSVMGIQRFYCLITAITRGILRHFAGSHRLFQPHDCLFELSELTRVAQKWSVLDFVNSPIPPPTIAA
jgi:hypothetical protein